MANEYDELPAHTLWSLNQYVEHGQATGGFLNKVLTNDLFGAVAQADLENRRALPLIVRYIVNRCPAICFGSAEKVDEWLRHNGCEGLDSGQYAVDATLENLYYPEN